MFNNNKLQLYDPFFELKCIIFKLLAFSPPILMGLDVIFIYEFSNNIIKSESGLMAFIGLFVINV